MLARKEWDGDFECHVFNGEMFLRDKCKLKQVSFSKITTG